jgi:hypothetical protein
MNVEELKKQYFSEGDLIKSQLEPLVSRIRSHCQIDQNGRVFITRDALSAKDKFILVVIARAVAAELEPSISAEVVVEELCRDTRLPSNQVRARGADAVKAKYVVSPRAGVYRAILHRMEKFLDGLGEGKGTRE